MEAQSKQAVDVKASNQISELERDIMSGIQNADSKIVEISNLLDKMNRHSSRPNVVFKSLPACNSEL